MDRVYYLWLQKIADLDENFNLEIYNNIFKEDSPKFLYDLSTEREKFEEYVKNKKGILKMSVINKFCSNKLKEKIKIEYEDIIKENNIITLNNYYNKCKGLNINIPFCFIVSKNYSLKKTNIYIFFESYFTKFARNLTYYFTKILCAKEVNVISEYNNELLDTYTFNTSFCDFNIKSKIFISNKKYFPFLYFLLIDAIIIIEARYEEKIVNIVNECLDFGKEIYVVPSNIFRKNSYFSNYLIKQGAQVILNKKDVINIIKNICG